MEAIETIYAGAFKAELHYDTDPQNPRNDCNLGELYLKGGRNSRTVNETSLNDYVRYWDKETRTWNEDQIEDLSRDEFEKYLDKEGYLWLRVYKYEHGGVAYNTTGFSCKWDSGQVGYIIVSKKTVRKEYGIKRITQKWNDKILDYLKGEIEMYSDWANGDVYGYRISKLSEDNPIQDAQSTNLLYEDFAEIESCWGFFGFEYFKKEVTELLNSYSKKVDKLPG